MLSEFTEEMKDCRKQPAYFLDEMRGFCQQPAYTVYLLRTALPRGSDPSSYQEIPLFFCSFGDAQNFESCIRDFSNEYAIEDLETKIRAVTFDVIKKPSDLHKIYCKGLIELSDGTIMHAPFLCPDANGWAIHYPAKEIPKIEIKRFTLPKEELERLMAQQGYRSWNEDRHDELVMQWSIYPIACSINNK